MWPFKKPDPERWTLELADVVETGQSQQTGMWCYAATFRKGAMEKTVHYSFLHRKPIGKVFVLARGDL